MNTLLRALDNENNENIFKKTSKQIIKEKYNILSELNLDDDTIQNLLQKLQEYMYVDEMPDITSGSYIKWIPLSNTDNIKLTRGAIVCDIDIINNEVLINCKNFTNKFFMLNLNKSIIFRKLNDQEKILLSVSNYLNT